MPPKLGQIVETILYTSDVTKSVEWYKRALDLTFFEQNPGFAGASLPNSTILLIFDRSSTKMDKDISGESSGRIPSHGCPADFGQHIAFACHSPAELEEWKDHLKRKNVDISGEMSWERGGRSIYFRDPEGHLLEIMTRGVWPVY